MEGKPKKLDGASVSIWTGPLSYAKPSFFPYPRSSTVDKFATVLADALDRKPHGICSLRGAQRPFSGARNRRSENRLNPLPVLPPLAMLPSAREKSPAPPASASCRTTAPAPQSVPRAPRRSGPKRPEVRPRSPASRAPSVELRHSAQPSKNDGSRAFASGQRTRCPPYHEGKLSTFGAIARARDARSSVKQA
jgi:hypothetical protein